MSSCSTSIMPQAHTPHLGEQVSLTYQQQQLPQQHEHIITLHGSPGPDGPDGPNGQHHLLRHVLSPEQCSDALRHFGTADSKAAARLVNRMSQRELRDMFARVYSVGTNSNNNTWLRRKLLEAVGASRRFYVAASRAGRPKGPRRNGGGAGGAASPRTPRGPSAKSPLLAPEASPAPTPLDASPALSPQALHSSPAHPLATAPGPALPAGSPRALCQRMRASRAHPHPAAHHYATTSPSGSPRKHAGEAAAATSRRSGGISHFAPFASSAAALPPLHHLHASSEEDTCSDGSGFGAASGAPRALVPPGLTAEAISPTAATSALPSPAFPSAINPFLSGCHRSPGGPSSLITSQFAAMLPPAAALPLPLSTPALVPMPPQPSYASPLPFDATAAIKAQALAPASSISHPLPLSFCPVPGQALPEPTVAAPLQLSAFASAAGSGASLRALPSLPSLDLGPGLLSCNAESSRGSDCDEWLAFEDWSLPPLF